MLEEKLGRSKAIEAGNMLKERKETLALAESVTCGLLQAACSLVPEASKFLQGGITAYNLGQKYRHLQIEPIHAQECNCVSPQVARQMAAHVCDKFSAQWGIGITGYAMPVPESNNELFAYYAIAHNCKVLHEGEIRPKDDEPFNIQLLYVRHVIEALVSQLQKM